MPWREGRYPATAHLSHPLPSKWGDGETSERWVWSPQSRGSGSLTDLITGPQDTISSHTSPPPYRPIYSSSFHLSASCPAIKKKKKRQGTLKGKKQTKKKQFEETKQESEAGSDVVGVQEFETPLINILRILMSKSTACKNRWAVSAER